MNVKQQNCMDIEFLPLGYVYYIVVIFKGDFFLIKKGDFLVYDENLASELPL